MMQESNRVFFWGVERIDRFYERIQHYVATAPAGSLAAMQAGAFDCDDKSRKSNTALDVRDDGDPGD